MNEGAVSDLLTVEIIQKTTRHATALTFILLKTHIKLKCVGNKIKRSKIDTSGTKVCYTCFVAT